MLYIIHTKNLSIYEQLKIEEALLRADRRNFCIINEGTEDTIVLGSSCKPALHINEILLKQSPIPVVKRFSGGGSVVVDSQTLFVSFIFNKQDHPAKPFPEPILRWTGNLYEKAWDIDQFQIAANDYAIGNRKCGGNAQYIQKDRWLHHTTFLWDYSEENMKYLRHPPTAPSYRNDREHSDFLCRIKEQHPCQDLMISQLKKALADYFTVEESSLEDTNEAVLKPHRKSTSLIEIK